jgi:hypothetical protein
MTKEKLLNQETIITKDSNNIVFRAKENSEGVWETVMVSNEPDRFNSIIEPSGFVGVASTIDVRGNHGEVIEGWVENIRKVENYDNGERVLAQALICDIHIPKTSEYINRNQSTGETTIEGLTYNLLVKRIIKSASVGFKPVTAEVYENDVMTRYNCRNYEQYQIVSQKERMGVRVVYTEWDCAEISLLKNPARVSAGQATSSMKQTRNQTNQPNMSLEQLQQALASGEITQEHLRSLLETEETKTPETDSATPEFQRSESKIEIKVGEPTGEGTDTAPKEGEGEETPPAPAEADQNGDGELSDSEVRSYIKELKRSYDSPAMISEKLGELERSFGEINERMNSMVTAGQTKTETDKSEAEMQRQYETTLSDIPNEAESQVSGDMKRQLDSAEKPKVEEQKDIYAEKYEETQTAITSGMHKF